MELKDFKAELVKLSEKPAYTADDIMKITTLATKIVESDRFPDAAKKEFGTRLQAIRQKGIKNLQTGEVKMVLNLFIQALP